MKFRFDEIDICKGIAMLSVFGNHSFIFHLMNIYALSWRQHAAVINSTYFVVLFFMVFDIFSLCQKRRKGYREYQEKVHSLVGGIADIFWS